MAALPTPSWRPRSGSRSRQRFVAPELLKMQG
ncbi:UNVERIFIED_CONTAM: hypothetical protein GTU68_062653 [Idotea baltica]|nr:hypothetical protein [Idotea baltica]